MSERCQLTFILKFTIPCVFTAHSFFLEAQWVSRGLSTAAVAFKKNYMSFIDKSGTPLFISIKIANTGNDK